LRILDSSYIDLCNGARVLEVGVGVGRLLKPLAMMRPDLDIYGIDVSKEMIRQGRERLKDLPKIHLFATGGNDLSPFSDGFFDLVFSYITFQHIPRAYVVNYFKEIHRVLKEGAIFRFQMQSPGRSPVKEPSNNDFRSIRYYGTEKIEHMCHDFGFRPLELTGTSYIWVTAEKSTRDGT
jgi:ubiquinone/menaquinone biosynthesis C-methylase UbiE